MKRDIVAEIKEELNSLPPYKYLELYNRFNHIIERIDVTHIKNNPHIVLSAMAIFSGGMPIEVKTQDSTIFRWDFSQVEEKRFIGIADMKIVSSWEQLETELVKKQLRQLEKEMGLKPFEPKKIVLPTMFGN